ncbi:glucose-1-phosphate thymidylyltransferase RfbA [Pigmentibacter sp. JX0631]|uniref:glucose-1-phosphate thymidylyltransferase RfbA n=1 Tax=Pigmentibacter sp. JX0631 TaxID=2976982 RepID=UPI0032AFECCC
MKKMKGIVLAGGSGTRLYPSTSCLSKQLLPVYDKPMIYYPISTLMMGGITEILIISTPRDLPAFRSLLGDGSQWGIQIEFLEQKTPAGLAQAFVIGEDFIKNQNVCLILGDNIFHGQGLMTTIDQYRLEHTGCRIFGYTVKDPERYGVIELDKNGVPISIEEKPQIPKSNIAITGLYFFDEHVSRYAKELKPSLRGELEITDLINIYFKQGNLSVEEFGRGVAWLDTGTHRSLLDASLYFAVLEDRQGLKIACPEEIAWRKGFINSIQFELLANSLKKSGYGEYLLKLLKYSH